MATPFAAPPPHHPQQGNGIAVAGMVLGILGLVLCFLPFVGWAAALVGVILSGLGIGKANKLGGKGKGMAIAGLVCGIVGLLIGLVLFFLVFTAARSFEAYVEKGRAMESKLQLRSIEVKVKSFYNEKLRLPNSAPEMPGPAGSGCPSGIAVQPMSAWTGGWQEMGFHVDEPSRCSYVWTSDGGGGTGTAEARCDYDCDGTISTTTLTIRNEQGMLRAEYAEPTPD